MNISYTAFNTPSFVQPIPFALPGLPNMFSAGYSLTDMAYDYAIGGIPFIGGQSLRGTYFRRQYERDFATIRKDQFDNQQVPGEQSILGWWLRSQSNFQGGAGVQYLDTSEDSTLGIRFAYSEHIDALGTPGNTRLLPATKLAFASVNTNLNLRGVNYNGVDQVLVADGTTLKLVTLSGVSSYTMPGGITNIVSLTDATGIWKGALNSFAAATKLWNVPSASGKNVLAWVKGRLVAGLDNSVYELVGGTPPILPTPKFTHFNPNWSFNSIAETPTAILVAGSSGHASQVHRFTLDTGGSLPVLSSGQVALELPVGEVINKIYGYLGTFVGLATSKGCRVAQVDANGDLTYGPLVVQTQQGMQAVSGYDRFLFFGNTNNAALPQPGFINPPGISGNSMLVRVDLSQATSTGGYPYANDLDAHVTGTVLDCCNFGNSGTAVGQMALSVSGQGVYLTDTANKEPSGILYTPRIRYNTLEPKHFKYIYMRSAPITDGSITVSAVDPGGGNANVYSQSSGTTTDPILIGNQGNQQEWLQFGFTIARGTSDHNLSPTMFGYQLRALPGVNRQIILRLPLSCHDFEMDKYGQPSGYDGYAYARMTQLEAIIASGNIVQFQDLNYNTSNLVIADDYHFEQQSNDEPKAATAGGTDSNALGGYILLTLRVVQ
jgi:hypothetical protein